MPALLLLFLAGLVLLYFGAEALVRGSGSLALRCGLPPLIAGLTVVAYGTGMPELVVTVKAGLGGQGGLAIGNIVGSNIFNVAVVLGLAAIAAPLAVRLRLILWDVPIMVVLCFALTAAVLLTGGLSRWMGAVLAVTFVIYNIWSIWMARRETDPVVVGEFAEAVPKPTRSAWVDVGLCALGMVLLAAGGHLLVEGAVGLARAWGVSEALIGLTLVAAGTSAPELAATFVAALRRETDIAVGNIVGSSIFNILCVGGFGALIVPLEAVGVRAVDLVIMSALAAVTLPLAWTGHVIKRWEGAVLFSFYLVFLWFSWP